MEMKSVIITGAGGNLGSAIVSYFIDHGIQVTGLVHHQSDQAGSSEIYREIEVNLMNENKTRETIDDVISKDGRIDAVILTAGGFRMGNIEKTSLEDLRFMYGLNFETAYNVVRPVLEQMKKQGYGKIFLTGSGQGMDTRKGKGVTAYTLSKSLLFQLANIINAETAGTGIKAHVIVPSTIDTPQNRKDMPDADFNQWQKPGQIAEIIGHYAENDRSETVIVIADELNKK